MPALDGVRGLAILLVLGHHSLPMLDQSNWCERLWCRVFDSGWFGVDLFFVLSGFLITGILLDTVNGQGYFRSFAVRRMLRIFPLYYGALLCLLVVVPTMLGLGNLIGISKPAFGDQIWYWFYAQNWMRVFLDNPPDWPNLGHFWSLAVEEQFYLVWPLLVFLFRGKRLRIMCWSIVVACLLSRFLARWQQVDVDIIYALTAFRFDSLAIGALAASYVRSNKSASWLERYAGRVAACFGVAVLVTIAAGVPINLAGYWVQTIGYTVLAFGFCALVLVANFSRFGIVGRVLEQAWLRHLGNRSYAIYVLHIPILSIFKSAYESALAPTDTGSRDVLNTLIGFLVVLVAAELSWHGYEKHFLKLKKYFPRAGTAPIRRPKPPAEVSLEPVPCYRQSNLLASDANDTQ